MRWSVVWMIVCLMDVALLSAAPSVETVAPGVGQRGTTFSLRIVGAGLSDAAEVLFYRRGLSCVDLKAESDNVVLATLQATADCPLGTHPLRVRTTAGISELKIVRVTPFPVIAETDTDDGTAQPIESEATVVGTLPGGDADRFRLALRRGDRLSAEVEGVRLGAGLTDTRLRVIAPDGRVVAEVDDTPLFAQDPHLSLIADRQGDYVVELSLSGTDGDDNSRYALHIGRFPRPKLVYPAGGPAGKPTTVRFIGDARGEWSQVVTPPRDPAEFSGLFGELDGLSAPTANPFRVASFDNVLEGDGNDSPAALPRAFNGILEQPGDVDEFRFHAESGAMIRIEAFANRVGSPADTVLSVWSGDGEELARNDDYEGLDSGLIWRCPQTGDYRLQITDKRSAGGPDFIYRVEAELVSPQVTAFLPRRDRLSQARQTVEVPQGNRVLALLGVQRRGWSGPAQLKIDQLPSGVEIEAGRFAADEYIVPVILEAAADAPLAGMLVPVTVEGAGTGASVRGGFAQVVDLVASSADRLYQGVTVDRLAVAVTEPAPFRLRLQPPVTLLPRGGTLEVVVHVEREPGFRSSVEVTFPFLPTWVVGPDKLTIPPDQTSGTYTLEADPQAAIQSWPLVAEGKPGLAVARDEDTNAAPGVPSYRRRSRRSGVSDQVVSTQLVPLEVADAPVTGAIGERIAEVGTTIRLSIPLVRTGALPDALTATLEGLPNRVTADPVEIAASDREVAFTVRLADDAPRGAFTSVVCRLAGEFRGQQVSYVVGRGGVLKIVNPGELVIDETGRALSPLEILRRTQSSETSGSSTGR